MSNLNNELLGALFAVIHAAPAAERAALSAALDAYVSTYRRTVRDAPPLLRQLMKTLREAVGSGDESGKIRFYDAFPHSRRMAIHEPDEDEHD